MLKNTGVDNCTYDGAGESLRWIYGSHNLNGGRYNNTEDLKQYLEPFDQRPFIKKNSYLAEEGSIFIPPQCKNADSECKLHVFLHGCGVVPTYPIFSTQGGFNEWAMNNKIVILYPKMGTSGSTKQLHSGCYDGYGQTGFDYDTRNGPQMRSLHAMITHFLSS